MIDIAEVKRIARSLGLNPTVIDLDYVLGCYLHYLGNHPMIKSRCLFKGGTALRKCYFEKYRFSEDLDFTLFQSMSINDIKICIDETNYKLQERIGIRTSSQEYSIKVIEDEYGRESYEVKLYYDGPWDYGGSSRSLRIHFSQDEKVIFKPNSKKIFHNYSDKNDLPITSISVYTLEEVLSEKLRAISGQRKYAVARDIYDIYFISRQNVNIEKSIAVLSEKFKSKGIDITKLRVEDFLNRKNDYTVNWERNLEYLIPSTVKVDFNIAWNSAIEILNKALE